MVVGKGCIDSPRGGNRRVAPTPNPPGLYICTATKANPKSMLPLNGGCQGAEDRSNLTHPAWANFPSSGHSA
eukprot:5429325-Pyramimonas_sp.AAC.1